MSIRKILSGTFLAVGLLSLAFTHMGCAVEEAATTTTDDSDDSDDSSDDSTVDTGEEGQNIAVEDFKVSFDTNEEYTTVWSEDSDSNFQVSSSEWGTECIAGDRDTINCILEVDELDLWSHDVTINIEVPGDLCAYLGEKHPTFALAHVGENPTVVYSSEDEDGNIVDVRYCYEAGGCAYDEDTPANNDANSDLYDPGDSPTIDRSGWAPVLTASDIYCPWDYSVISDDYQNCCEGEYRHYQWIDDGTGTYELTISDPTDWGGAPLNCMAGSGLEDDLGRDDDGYPVYTVTEVIGDGYGKEYTVAKRSRFNRFANLPMANYFLPSEHNNSDEDCDSLVGDHDNAPTKCPKPLGFVATDPVTRVMGYPFHTYECLDHNFEVVARIDVMVREWNTKDEMLLEASGDPNVIGFEDAPFSARRNNDYCDWKDFGSDTENVCSTFDYTRFAAATVFNADVPGN